MRKIDPTLKGVHFPVQEVLHLSFVPGTVPSPLQGFSASTRVLKAAAVITPFYRWRV